jgi:hypothetical protein
MKEFKAEVTSRIQGGSSSEEWGLLLKSERCRIEKDIVEPTRLL